jgi:hypothetical protein
MERSKCRFLLCYRHQLDKSAKERFLQEVMFFLLAITDPTDSELIVAP